MADETTATLDAPAADVSVDAAMDALGTAGKLPQKVDISDAGPCKKHVRVTVDRSAIDERIEEKYGELLKDRTAALPGFRPGKAPKKMIKRRFESAVKEEVRREILMASLQQLAEDSDIAPLSTPSLDPDKLALPDEGPFVYEFVVEVRPDFDLPEYKGVKIVKPVYTIGDAEIAAELQNLLQSELGLIEKAEGIDLGDTVDFDLATFDGDKALNKLEGLTVRVNKQLALDDAMSTDFGSKLAGAKVGEKRTIDLQIAERAADKDLHGKTVRGEVTVKAVRGNQPVTALTPAMLSKYGVTSQAALEELIATSLERKLEYNQRQSAKNQLMAHFAGKVKFDLPRDMLYRQAEKTLERAAMEMRYVGMSETDIEARLKASRLNVLRNTAATLTEHFVLQKIAEVEKIEIGDAEIDAEIARIASERGESYRKVRAQFEREQAVEVLAAQLLERKALDIVLNNAVFEEKTIKVDETQGEIASVSGQVVPGELLPIEAPAAVEAPAEPAGESS